MRPHPTAFAPSLIVWVTQSVSVFGSALTFFATTIWLTQVLYPSPEQKPELALALSAISLAFALPTVVHRPDRRGVGRPPRPQADDDGDGLHNGCLSFCWRP